MGRKPVLVANWKQAWRWWSVRLSAALAAIGPIWLTLPQDVKDNLPVEWLPWVSPVVILSIVVARVIDQTPPEPKE